jgi:hypothetical protein
MAAITELYLEAKSLLEAGERVISTDEMTGIQALERKHPTIPMGPGRVERREFEYKRHGTVTLTLQRHLIFSHVRSLIYPYHDDTLFSITRVGSPA